MAVARLGNLLLRPVHIFQVFRGHIAQRKSQGDTFLVVSQTTLLELTVLSLTGRNNELEYFYHLWIYYYDIIWF